MAPRTPSQVGREVSFQEFTPDKTVRGPGPRQPNRTTGGQGTKEEHRTCRKTGQEEWLQKTEEDTPRTEQPVPGWTEDATYKHHTQGPGRKAQGTWIKRKSFPKPPEGGQGRVSAGWRVGHQVSQQRSLSSRDTGRQLNSLPPATPPVKYEHPRFDDNLNLIFHHSFLEKVAEDLIHQEEALSG